MWTNTLGTTEQLYQYRDRTLGGRGVRNKEEGASTQASDGAGTAGARPKHGAIPEYIVLELEEPAGNPFAMRLLDV